MIMTPPSLPLHHMLFTTTLFVFLSTTCHVATSFNYSPLPSSRTLFVVPSSSSSLRSSSMPSWSSSSPLSSSLSKRFTTPLIMSSQKPRGSAATPIDKKKIAIFGGGGYLGALTYGYLQRASSLYPTGIKSVRCLCATAYSSLELNKHLTRSFTLAYAGEDAVSLVDMTNEQSVVDCLTMKGRSGGVDAVVVGTVCRVERRPVTGNTYEKSPNDKTWEFYLDDYAMASKKDEEDEDGSFHVSLFRDRVRACRLAGVKHLVVVETPRTKGLEGCEGGGRAFAKVLDEEGVDFTYICTTGGDEWMQETGYTFQMGLRGNVDIESLTLRENYGSAKGYEAGDWFDSLSNDDDDNEGGVVAAACPTFREDIAAVVVQSLLSLDWGKSRVLKITTTSRREAEPEKKNEKYDRTWCKNSEVLAEKLAVVE